MRTHDAGGGNDAYQSLWADFIHPPDAARPRAWWHWMDGNIDPAGIRRDLTWLHAVGVRGVQLFDGGMGVPLVVPEAVRPGSPAWTEAIDAAVDTSNRLGMELAVATSSGWSAAGGPWVAAEDAMKKVVWSETLVEGGGRALVRLAPLPAVAGLYQDSPREDGPPRGDFAVDWRALALPHRAEDETLRPTEVSASAPLRTWDAIVDGSFDACVALPRDPDAWSAAWIEQRFDSPVTVRSVTVGLPGPRGFGAAPAADAVLQVSDDGMTYRDVVRLEPTTVPARTASFAPVAGRWFRLVLSGGSAAEALPPTAPGVRLPPVLRRAHEFRVSEFALRTDARVHHAEVKAGFGVVADYYAVDGEQDAGAVSPHRVIDVTSCVRDGLLDWSAPEGRWLILRVGASLTGQTNGPAPQDSTGLEVDKLAGDRVTAYLREHLRRFGGEDATPSRFAALLSDSIEAGPQNWTDRVLEEFTARRGYDPLPWIPALTGRLIGSAAETDRFLFDYRRTLSDLLGSEYYGTLGAEARRRQMTYYSEALEDRRPQLGDDLAMRSHADIPMGAMWTFAPDVGPRPTYVADLKGASSVAHVYGKAWTGSEAFTSFDQPWSWSPQSLKHIADLQLALGVTRFCIHTSPHQPLAAPPPGIALAPFLGQSFTVHETWSTMAGPWIDYLARCSAVLSAGRPAVDIAVFVGEEAPVTGLYQDAVDMSVPPGFDFDYIGPDALADVIRVADGRLEAEGATYRLLFLGGSCRRMTLAALTQLERIVAAGGVVVGMRPESSPSLADDPRAFSIACDRLWSSGRVIASDLPDALVGLGMAPALVVDGGAVRRIARIVGDRLVTFLSNPTAATLRLRLTPAHEDALAGWDPVTVQRVRIERDTTEPRPTWTVELPPFGSLFVVPEAAPPAPSPRSRIALDGVWTVELPNAAVLSTSPHPVRWTDLPAADTGFSGTAVYRHEFSLEAGGRSSALLDFTSVDAIARVVMNDIECGIAWTSPFRVDVSQAVRTGRNSLVVHVATPWRNRLISEAEHPTGELFPPVTGVFDPTARPLPAGLDGPVHLLIAP
ncbi:glycosyl hydrolase [Microbacterium sp. RU33B]|uniref:glycosyl hydrolase n=1 Tax=Microbacterium sp. RU33B TaxID=1907390 RepID=UPI000964D8D4|nr:glycosyl hydrolase [Microbacterium sp. RU33B]SIT67310.1 alpha-L-rhamnosidase [Microbacterium sp. RU33B]